MIRIYKFEYDFYSATADFKVDTEKFTEEMALETLNFFHWYYDDKNDPIDEVMRKYALVAIRISTFENYNAAGVIMEFDSKEGFCKLDGTDGIELISISGYEFEDEKLEFKIVEE